VVLVLDSLTYQKIWGKRKYEATFKGGKGKLILKKKTRNWGARKNSEEELQGEQL
jgi:hypothetical protein